MVRRDIGSAGLLSSLHTDDSWADQISSSDPISKIIGSLPQRETIASWERRALGTYRDRSSNCSVWVAISASRYGSTSVIRSLRAAHIPAQMGSRCNSAPLTSAGVDDRDCSTMLII